MNRKSRLQRLEKESRINLRMSHFYMVVPDDWEGEVPEGYWRRCDIPKEFPKNDWVIVLGIEP